MTRSTLITMKGTTTIPKEVRNELGMKAGDRVRYVVNENGRYEISKEPTLEDVRNMNAQYTKAVPNYTDEELKKLTREGMQQQAVERYKRSLN